MLGLARVGKDGKAQARALRSKGSGTGAWDVVVCCDVAAEARRLYEEAEGMLRIYAHSCAWHGSGKLLRLCRGIRTVPKGTGAWPNFTLRLRSHLRQRLVISFLPLARGR